VPDGFDFDIEVEGAKEVERSLDQLAGEVEDPKLAITKISAGMARAASLFAPRREGVLAASVRPAPERDAAAATTSLVYAGPVNSGWPKHNIKASLFMERAQTATEPLAKRVLEDDIDLTIRRKGLS
jgi:hypothetical protein